MEDGKYQRIKLDKEGQESPPRKKEGRGKKATQVEGKRSSGDEK